MKRLCLHIELDVDSAGLPCGGTVHVCWDNQVKKVLDIESVNFKMPIGQPVEESRFNAFAALMEGGYQGTYDKWPLEEPNG